MSLKDKEIKHCGKKHCHMDKFLSKDVVKAMNNFEERSLKEKVNNVSDNYGEGWNAAIIQLLAIHDDEFGDLK